MLLQTRLRIVGLLSVIGIVGAACAELPAITENQCGNRIVDTGEDCDTFASNGSSCRAAGSDGACHFDCSGTNVCPPTFSCGLVDKICRQATGTYDVANAQTIFAPTTSLSIVDYDGDGRADALTSGPNDVRIHYFDNRLSLSKTLLLPIQNPKFHVGPIGDDTVADLAILRPTGLIDVFRGQSDRTLAPVVYSSFPIPNTNVSGRAFLARNQISNTTGDPAQRPTGDDIFAFGSTDKGVSAILDLAGRDVSGTTAAAADEVVALPDSPVDNLAGSVAVGSYIEGSVCDQFAIGFVGDTKVDLYTPCRPSLTPKTYELNTVDARYVAPTRVELPAGATVGVSEQADASTGASSAGVFSIDANGDGHDDLVIAGTALSATQIFIAYGIGDGTFSSSPTLSPVDNNAAALPGLTSLFANIVTTQLKSDLPLAIADLNHDKILDYVFPSFIYFSESQSLADGGPNGARYLEVATAPNGVTWTSAVVADVNRDGLPDIAATNPTGSIDFFLGTGGDAMSYLSYGLDGVPTNIVAGDFDGDLVNDLAFSVSGVAAQDAGASSNAIEVLFGQQQAFPAQPVSLGSSPSVVALVAAPLAPQYTGTAAPTDTTVSSMVALTVDAASNEYAAILQGNTDRIITSSFSLTPPTTPRGFVVRAQTGPMTTAKQNDVMFISRDTATAAGSTVGGVTTPPKYSFWYAPSTGEATLSASNLTEGPTLPSTGIGWEQATLTGPSPEPNGIATTILIAPPPEGLTGQPQLFVVDPKALTLGPAIPVPCNYANVTGAASIELRSSDFDGDGFHDLLVFCPDVSNVAVIVVYWGDGTSAYLASRMSKVPVPSDPLTSYASDREGAVSTRSVLMLTQLNLYSSTPGGSDGRTFGPPVKNLTLPGGNEINVGDIDGDGVLDLGIVDNTKTQVQFFRGIPVNDSASVP